MKLNKTLAWTLHKLCFVIACAGQLSFNSFDAGRLQFQVYSIFGGNIALQMT